ncbi:receptor-like protein 15 isoform X1 [Macadamia integrifolia]|uniref:receptor-like protein 15 isoform X1 n=1 Tax=Macadamia integrifolia TaxID=60698 RepID=UPI001C4E4FAC|nr:receptor-like protein 15 isoform X1 [Macadamia integrifolia]
MKCLWIPLVLLLLRFQHCCCLGCLEEERIALLEFKASCDWSAFRSTGDCLPSWVDAERGSNSSDCCSWERVECNVTTGRVIQLSLSDIGGTVDADGILYGSYSVCDLNVTIFSIFKELQHLNLSYNLFDGWVKNEGFERLGGLTKLEVLDLSNNNFNNASIFSSLGELQSLTTLSLSENYLGGSINLEAFISTLPNLKSLDLSYNFLEGMPSSSHTKQGSTVSFVGLGKLEALYLGRNYFSNSILPFLGALTSLKTLSLGGNNFEASTHMEELTNLHNLQSLDLSGNGFNCSFQPILQELANNLPNLESLDLSRNNFNCSSSQPIFQALCGMKRLQELHLSRNNFEGILPPCLQNLTSLRTLDLSYNQFTGNIQSSIIASLSSLSQIFLGYNDFEGTFTFKSFANTSKLEVIDFRSAGSKLEVETEHPPWVPLFQLKTLSLSNCSLNKQSNNDFPSFLSTQYNLREIDHSHCNLSAQLPPWLLENNKLLESLNLRDNSLRGHFLLPSYVHIAARSIDISNNCIDGLLQENIGYIFPNAEYLNLSVNTFEGGIPSSIGNMSYLSGLDLSNNNFIGEIPKHMGIGCSKLVVLGLSNNELQGQVFPADFNLTQLESLYLDNNSFSGDILRGLSKCLNLWILDISNNQLTGRIPSWMGNLTSLTVLKMRGNLLQGNIPIEFQVIWWLEFLDLSENHLSGSIVSVLNSTNLQYLHLQGNGFIGSPSIALINNSNLLTLDIRNNNLCGGIPDWIASLSGLRILLLQGNHLNGPIPNNFCQLEWIRLMDLSHNSLSGSIPQCFNNISFGRRIEKESISNIKSEGFWEIGSNSKTGAWVGAAEGIEFMTKNMYFSYKGGILNFMSGMDLSFNNLTGGIPHEIGTLNGIHALNLSHNKLTGSIPKTFSNLEQIESLDLSYNKLTGEIPSELTVLNFLAVFTVAYNNLSGKTPEMQRQFSTFDSFSYEGNPYLCGLPLPKTSFCSSSGESTNTFATTSNDMENEDEIDMTAFASSFAASYVVCLLGLATILYINPYWRRMWFHFIGVCIYSCHDFLFDTYYKLCIHVRRFRMLIWKTLIE